MKLLLRSLFQNSLYCNRSTTNSRNYFAFFTFLLLFTASWHKSEATHSAGGYVSYQYLSPNTYRFTVTFYRDCAGIAAPSAMEIDVNSSCGFGSVDAPLISVGTEIGYPCPSSTTCNGGSNPGFQKYIYQVDAVFGILCDDWVVSFQPSALSFPLQTLGRNNAITTLVPPLGNLYTETGLDNVNYPTNSSVRFINDPILFVCAGQSATFNLGATDLNGDSLVYDLVDAREDFFFTVLYMPPLSGANPLFPGAGAVTINRFTGDVTINTNVVQVGVINILVREYRNGVLVGYVVLDIQVVVQTCTNNYPTVSGINGTNVFVDSVCAGNVISFFVTSGDPDVTQLLSMTWNSGIPAPAFFSSTGSPHPSGTFTWSTTAADARAQPYTFTVTVQDNACPANGFQTHAYSIYVIAPTITVSPTTPIVCNGQSVSLTAGGGSTYSWAPGSSLSATTGTTVSASPTTTTTYTVTGTDAGGCSNTKAVTVTVNPKPTIGVSPSAPIICNGQSVSLTASGGSSYGWAPSGGLSAVIGTVVSANPTATTTYTITGTDADGCSNTKTVTVTVNPLPTITVNPAAPILCTGQSVSLTAGGGTSFVWSPSTGLSATTGTTVSANPPATTTYTITGTDANGCTNTKSVTVSVNPLPTINVVPPTPILCNGQSVSLTASGGSSYIWSPSGGLSATTGSTVTANPSSTSTYTVTGTDANSCTNTKSVTVTINPLPTITVNPSAPVLCIGQSVSLTAGGGTSFVWSPSSGLSATTGSTVSANPSSTTTYTITGTDANGCSNTKSVTVSINALPTITVNPTAPVLCNGQSVSLTAGGGTTFIWSPSSGLSGTTGTTVSAGPGSTTTYTVTGTDANGCTNTSSVTVSVNPLPAINVSPVSPVLCSGQSVALNASGGSSYIWGPSTGLSGTTGSSVTAGPASTTTYTVTGTDANGCTNTKTVTVSINALPTITASPVSPILCNGQSVSLTAGGGTSYVWSPSTGLSGTSGSTVSAGPAATTTYTVTGTDANGCSNTKSVTVTINQLPAITVNPPSPSLCNGASVALTAGGGNTYIWSPSSGLSATTGSTVTANPASTSTYTITGTDANGCTGTASVTVSVIQAPTITINPTTPILCNGQSISLTAGGGNTYVWSPSTGLSATTGTSVTANPSSTTTYTVTGTIAGGCVGTQTVTVTINPRPVITANPTAPVLCNGQSISLTAGGGNTYVWSPTTGLSSGSGSTVSANPSVTTSYTVTGSDGNGCTNTASVTVTINQKPTITVNPAIPVLCNGQSISLTAGGATTYVWNPTTGLSAGSGTTVSANPSSTTTYSVTGTDANGCTNTTSITVTVNPRPVITATPPTPVLCNGQSITLTAGGGTGYVWTPTTGLSAGSGAIVSANPSTSTTYTVIGTDANGCTNTSSVVVTVNPLPVITASPAAPVLCVGQSVTLTAGGGNSYIWSPTTGLSGGTGAVVSANPATTTSYTVTGTDANGCTNTATVAITVNPLPVIGINPTAPVICNGKSVSLTASGGTIYTWSPTTGLSSGSGTTVSAGPSATTTYSVTGTDANGCTSTASVTVSVNALPVVNAIPATPVLCNGQSVGLTASGGTSYTWSPTTGLSAGTGTTVTANPSSTTTYVVTGTDVNGCSNTSSVTVTVNPLPAINASPAAPVICNGKSVSLTASGGTGYVWSPTTGLSAGTGATVSANPSATTTYVVTGTDANGCSNTASVSVTVNPLPVITVSPLAPAICFGQSVALTASGGTTYAWSPITGLSSGTGATVTATSLTTTIYTVTGTDANGCTNTATTTVNVNPLPGVSASPVSPVLCIGQSVSLTASGSTAYTWSPTTGLSSGSGANVTADPTTTTTYTVTGSDANGCSNTASVMVTVNPLPVITASPAAPVICLGQSVTFTAGGGTSFAWSPTTGLSSDTGKIVSADAITSTVYTVTGTDANGCSNTASVSVTVNPLPVISVLPVAPAICYGQSVGLTASGGTSYAWSPTTGLSSGTGTTVTANPLLTTIYTVTGTDANGCTNTASATVTINPLPTVNAGADASICDGASTPLNVTGPPPGSTYIWTPSSNLSCSNCANPTANPASTTTYVVSVTDPNGCQAQDSVRVSVTPLVVHAEPDTVVCAGTPVQLHASGGTIYSWSPGAMMNDSSIANPVATPMQTTTYTVTVTSGSCTETTTVTITTFPNLLTPIITISNDTLYCSYDPSYVSYQWYDNSTLIPGATQSYYKATHSGNYNVAVYDEHGCSISVGINIIINVGIKPVAGTTDKLFIISPNPATEQFTIQGLDFAVGHATVDLYNMLGEKVLSKKFEIRNAKAEVPVNVSGLAAGTYFVEVLNEKTRWMSRFVKE